MQIEKDKVVAIDYIRKNDLAGMALDLDITVQSVRDATAEELDHGHVHDGHVHE